MATLRSAVLGHGEDEDEREDGDELPAGEGRGHAEQREPRQRDEQAEHEDVAVGEVDQLDDAVHHRVAERDQREDGPAGEAVDGLLDEDFPPLHGSDPVEVEGGPRRPALHAVALLEDGLELELAADRPVRLHRLEAGHGVVVDVAVLVEAPLAVDALEVLGGGDRLAQRPRACR